MRNILHECRGEAALRPYEKNRAVLLFALAILILAALVVTSGARTAVAQSGGGYDLTWNSIDGGGITFSAGGSYLLGGTIGQPDAGAMSGGSYTLRGGFWGVANLFRLFLPLIEK